MMLSLLLESSNTENTCSCVQSSEMAYCLLQVVICCFLYFFLYVYLTYKVTKRLQLKSYTGEAYVYLYPAPACMGLVASSNMKRPGRVRAFMAAIGAVHVC